ncbi:hypothetical protein LUZ61_017727 [Rhynchospora tenuis]|uniref:UBA domain-containing protein n=1 Tax=Rhynchospora tenuis TaxID=198213 RepID=A0AAD6ELA1_9POAL|nr:hypothetical protein LUZ61_017727 [Rhynchospora tenuis]
MVQNEKLSDDTGELLEDSGVYRRLGGRLIYLTITRPDITYSVHVLSQFLQNPRKPHLEAAYRVLRYLKGSPGHGILLSRISSLSIRAYCDSDWAGCPTTRRSTTGYVTFLGTSPVSWRTKRQNVVSRSSAEAEYRSMANTVCELSWLRYIFDELGVPHTGPMMLYCDNQAALHIASNPVFYERTKHIELDCHLIREKIQSGIIATSFVPSSQQLADVFTKALGKAQFQTLIHKLADFTSSLPLHRRKKKESTLTEATSSSFLLNRLRIMRELRKRLEMAEPEVDRGLLKELELIGFPTNRATRALYYTGNCSLEAALNWVIEHENDSDIDQMLLVPVYINIEDGNQFSIPEEVNLKAQKMRGSSHRNAKKLEEPKTLQTEVDKVTTAIKEATIKDPKNAEDERERILAMLRTKREEDRRTGEMQLKEDQLERMRTNKELMEAKRQLEASQRKRSVEQAGLEKEEERKARERIRRRIEQDKAERRVKLGLPNEGPKAADPIVPPVIEKREAGTLLVKSEQFKECLRSCKRNHKGENAKVQRAFQTLLKIVGNIAKNPNEDKYRRIRLSNHTFLERVGNLEGAIEFLELCGFEKAKEGEEQYLLMPKDKINVQILNSAGNELLLAMSNPYFGLLSK